jgi:Spy/CpxP family protein refolding chaperone
MKKIQAFAGFSFLLFALGAWAFQTQPSNPNSSQYPSTQSPSTQPPSSQSPSTQPQTAPSEPSQTQPQQPGQAPPSQSQGQPSSIDEQVKALSLELNLTSDQQPKLKSILEDQRSQGMAIVSDKATTREDKVQKLHALRESTISKVRSMLTPDQQKKLDQMLQEPEQASPHDQSSGPPKK